MSSPELENEASEEKAKLSLEIKVGEPNACQRHVTVTISREDVDRYLNEAYSELMPSASVPGFRSGRAPRKLVEQRFQEQIADQVKGSLLMDSMTQVTEQQDFSAISEPDFNFDAIEIPEEGPLTFEFDLEVRPEFEMPKWKGLKLERLKHEVSKPDTDREIETMLGRQGQIVPFDGAAGEGDFVVVNIRCSDEGNEVSATEEQTVRIRPTLSFHDARIEGFDKLMKGAKAGDKKTAQAGISHDSESETLQGKTVDVEFEVLEVKKLELPKLDEELLNNLGVATEGDLRDSIKEVLERRATYQQQRRTRQQITSLLTETADWDLPPELLKKQSKRELDRAVLELRSNGFGEEEIKAYENELRQNSLESTKTALHEHFILERIAEDEEFDAEPDDFETEIKMIASQSNEPIRRVRARIEKKGLMDALRNQIIERKVIELITEHADFQDVDYNPEVNETEAVDLALCGPADSEIPEAKHGGDTQSLQQPVDRA
ncbi:MAG: trigger factor [Planctomycetaceae bacterium]|nr:trigger factor [Planctomycetaceae bacterium]